MSGTNLESSASAHNPNNLNSVEATLYKRYFSNNHDDYSVDDFKKTPLFKLKYERDENNNITKTTLVFSPTVFSAPLFGKLEKNSFFHAVANYLNHDCKTPDNAHAAYETTEVKVGQYDADHRGGTIPFNLMLKKHDVEVDFLFAVKGMQLPLGYFVKTPDNADEPTKKALYSALDDFSKLSGQSIRVTSLDISNHSNLWGEWLQIPTFTKRKYNTPDVTHVMSYDTFNSLIKSEQAKWLPLPEVLFRAKSLLVEKPLNVMNIVQADPVMKGTPGLLSILGGKYGIRSVSDDYQFGFSSSVFSIGNNQILYLSRTGDTEYYPESSTFLPVLKKLELTDNISGYVCPKVDVLRNINEPDEKKSQMAVALFKRTLEEGNFFYDISLENIGVLKDKTPIMFDRDSFIKLSNNPEIDKYRIFLNELNKNEGLKEAFKYPVLDTMIDAINYTPDPQMMRSTMHGFFDHVINKLQCEQYDFKGSVDKHLRENNLEIGKVNGVFDSDFILTLRDKITEMGLNFRKTNIYDLLVKKGYNSEALFEKTGIQLKENSVEELLSKFQISEVSKK